MKKINYNNPIVASYLFIGGIFFVIGIPNDFIFFLIGIIFIAYGIKVNNKITEE